MLRIKTESSDSCNQIDETWILIFKSHIWSYLLELVRYRKKGENRKSINIFCLIALFFHSFVNTMSQVKGIGGFGSTALLVSSMTVSIHIYTPIINRSNHMHLGPWLIYHPGSFPTGKKKKKIFNFLILYSSFILQSGWLPPVFIFLVIAVLSGCSALFVCEALSNIKGNEKFQVN